MKNSFFIFLVLLTIFSSSYTIEPLRLYIRQASTATGAWQDQVAQALNNYVQKGSVGLAKELVNYQALSPEELATTNPQAVNTLMLALVNYNWLNKLTSQEFKLNNLENSHVVDLLGRTGLEAGILAAATYKKQQLSGKVLPIEQKLSDAIGKYLGQVFDSINNNTLTKEKANYAQELLALATKELKAALAYSI